MIRLGSIFGLVFSLALIFAVYMGTPEAPGAEAQATAAPGEGCVAEKVALDEGYGVTRTETRIVCAKDSKDKDQGAGN
jgi:hypothetical protein